MSDVYGVVDSDRERGEKVRPTDRPVVPGLIRTGARIQMLRVVEAEPDRFELASPSTKVVLLGLGGVVSLVIGLRLAFGISLDGGGMPRGVGGGRLVALLIVAPVAFGFYGTGQLTRLGHRLIFESEPRRLVLRRLFFWEQGWAAEELEAVVLVVSKVNRESQETQTCEVFVVDPEGKAVASFEPITNKRGLSLQALAQAAVFSAEMLDLPVRIHLVEPPVDGEVRRAIDMVRLNGRFETDRDETAVFKSPITIERVAGIATLLVVLVPFVKMFLNWIP
ncbi:MAG TPA: hypothetical protein VFT74_13340 [Isosphaeraceae bacterium]|nr:hypothetical protein [Isosphaeraceae bacterium]